MHSCSMFRPAFVEIFILAFVCGVSRGAAAEPAPRGLWKLLDTLKESRWVDLTHSFDSSIPHWKGFEPMKTRVLYDHDKDGFKVEEFCHVGQWGTHVDLVSHGLSLDLLVRERNQDS